MRVSWLLAAVAVLVGSLGVAFGGIVVLVKWGKLEAGSPMGKAGIGLLVLGLVGVGVAGGMWRANGGGRIGASRTSRRIERMLD